jgi:hypothetical protein
MSPRKRFSLPLLLVFLLVLFFLAGAPATLYHKDPQSRASKVPEDPGAVSRKLLRVVRRTTESQIQGPGYTTMWQRQQDHKFDPVIDRLPRFTYHAGRH